MKVRYMEMAKTASINERMTYNEASKKYPNSYILMQMDDMISDMGTVLFVFDTRSEAYEKLAEIDDIDLCGIFEGLHLQRSLGGIVVGC